MLKYGFDILRATEAAAIAASECVGCGDKNLADQMATDAMRHVLNNIDGFTAKIAIGEGKKDNAPAMLEGECVGNSSCPSFEIAVDPLDGTSQVAKGGTGAMSVIAVGNSGSFLKTETFYMLKAACGPRFIEAAHLTNITSSILSKNLGKLLYDINKENPGQECNFTVCILDRPRHEEFIKTFRKYGWRVKLIQDCDVSAAIGTAIEYSSIDLYYGIGGAPEGVIAAAFMKCLGGHFEGTLVDDKTYERIDGKVLSINNLAAGDVLCCATGITDGHLLKGVRSKHRTHSVLMYSGTKRAYWIDAHD